MADTIALDALIASWELALEAENKSPRTVVNYRESLDLFTRWLVDHQQPTDPLQITTEVLRGWLAELLETRSASTARTRWTALRGFWAWAADEREIGANPMADVKPPAVPEVLVQMLTAVQLRELLASCEGPRMVDKRDLALILLYADTGARLSEVVGAEVSDLDLRGRSLRIMGKGRRQRVVPFGARTARALDRYLRVRARQPYAHSPWLWLSGKDGRAISGNAVAQMLRRRGREIGVPGLHAHMLRHGFADAWLKSGGNESDLMELAGWRSRQMLTRYAAATRAERAREAYRSRSPMDRL
jgi:integrase/recombinase XerC